MCVANCEIGSYNGTFQDELFGHQWYLQNTGQSENGKNGIK
jgi:hypothetical protein